MTKSRCKSTRTILGRMTLPGVMLVGIQIVRADPIPLPCWKPNSNTILCTAVPPKSVTCTAQKSGNCVGNTEYDIKNFPDGIVGAQTGSTAQQQADCWRSAPCIWNSQFLRCETDVWSGYTRVAETIVGQNPCP